MKEAVSRSVLHTTNNKLPRSKILRGRRNFERLFEKSTVLNSDSLQFRYRLYNDPAEGCYIGFIAPKKKIRGAVKRNKAKRLMRESYRINQHLLEELFLENKFGLHGVFMAGKDDLSFEETRQQVVSLLTQARERLSRYKTDGPDKGGPACNHKI